MFGGHVYVIAIITAIQIVSFKEVIAIATVPSKARNLRFTKALNWYFLATTMYFLYGESIIYYFKHILLVDKVLLPFATHHRFISFMLYCMGMAPQSLTSHLLLINQRRFCLLCWLVAKRSLPFPIHTIRLDAHGTLPHRRPSSFHHEQRL